MEEVFGVQNYPRVCAEVSIQIAKEKGVGVVVVVLFVDEDEWVEDGVEVRN